MIPSPERVVVEWAKANANITALTSTRISTRLPNNPTLPFLTCLLVEGAPDSGDTTVVTTVQWDVYSDSKDTADTLYRTLITELQAVQGYTATDGILLGAVVLQAREIIESDTGWFRYLVDALMQFKEV